MSRTHRDPNVYSREGDHRAAREERYAYEPQIGESWSDRYPCRYKRGHGGNMLMSERMRGNWHYIHERTPSGTRPAQGFHIDAERRHRKRSEREKVRSEIDAELTAAPGWDYWLQMRLVDQFEVSSDECVDPWEGFSYHRETPRNFYGERIGPDRDIYVGPWRAGTTVIDMDDMFGYGDPIDFLTYDIPEDF